MTTTHSFVPFGAAWWTSRSVARPLCFRSSSHWVIISLMAATWREFFPFFVCKGKKSNQYFLPQLRESWELYNLLRSVLLSPGSWGCRQRDVNSLQQGAGLGAMQRRGSPRWAAQRHDPFHFTSNSSLLFLTLDHMTDCWLPVLLPSYHSHLKPTLFSQKDTVIHRLCFANRC